jgi:general secretion pathway protein D
MSNRILYYAGLGSLLLVWVVGQTPNATPQPSQPTAVPPVPVPQPVLPPGVPGGPGAPGTPAPPKANPEASPTANGISADGKLPTIPAGQKNNAVKAPNPNDICDFAFNFPKLNAEGLGYIYRQLTGRRVVMTAEVKDLEIYFVQPPPITYGEAQDLLKASCLMHGFVFAPGGDGWDKLTTANQGPKPGTGDIPLVTSPLALPEGDEVVRYVMTLKYMKPDEVSRVFQTVVTQFNSFGSVVAVPNASALIITENTSLIRSLIELQAKIDVPSSNIETKFIKVQYGDVEELAATLNEIFTAQSSAESTAGVQRVTQGGAPPVPGAPQAAGASSSGAGEAPPIQIVPDIRTNRIFVMARPLDLVFIESLVKEFDTPSDQRNFLRRKLKFLAVGDFLDVASDALSRAFGGAASSGGAAGAAGGGGRASTSTSLGRGSSSTAGGGASSRSGASTSQFGGSNSGQFGGNSGGGQFGGGGGGAGSNNLSDPQVDTKPVSVLVGRTLLVADNITNSIVVQGPPAGVEIINNLLDEIDVKADQVMISTVFGQLTLSNNLEYGIDWFRSLDETGDGAVAGKIGQLLPDIDPDTGNIVEQVANGGLGVYGKIGEHLQGYLRALQETGDFNVISRPTIFTANNQKGYISSGQQIAVPSNSFNGGLNGGGQSTNIEYRDVVLSLEVVPLVNSEDEVTLQISLVSQGVGENRKIGAGVNAFEVPDIISRELLTTVTVPNNQTVVLGGLITEENTKQVNGVPILCQIPGLGKLFSSTSDKKTRNELIIFIQPKIIRDERTMDAANRDMDRRYEMSGKIRDFDGPGVLPIKPVEEIDDSKGSEPEPQKVSNPVSLKAPNIDYDKTPKAKPVGDSSFWDRLRK